MVGAGCFSWLLFAYHRSTIAYHPPGPGDFARLAKGKQFLLASAKLSRFSGLIAWVTAAAAFTFAGTQSGLMTVALLFVSVAAYMFQVSWLIFLNTSK
jgi:hypothetical protein